MKVTKSLEQLDATLHIGKQDSNIVITILVSNNSDMKFNGSSGNGMWSQISLIDEDNLSRLEGVATVAAVTHWEIDSDEHLYYKTATETPEEASETWSELEKRGYNYISNPEKYKENKDQDKTYFAHSLDIEKEKDIQFTAEADIFFEGGHNMSITFKPHEIDEEPIETDSLKTGKMN